MVQFINTPAEELTRKDLIRFVIDPGGRPLYVSIFGGECGKVFYDRMALGFEEPLIQIANSFEEFIDGLE